MNQPMHVEVVGDDGCRSEFLGALLTRGVDGFSVHVAEDPLLVAHADLVHVLGTGPLARAAVEVARRTAIPTTTCYREHADFARVYERSDVVFSGSRMADLALLVLGVAGSRIHRWVPGVDHEQFHPGRYAPTSMAVTAPARFNVLHVGPAADPDLVADALRSARDRDPRIHLVQVGDDGGLTRRLGPAATALGAIDRDTLARIDATADLLLFASTDDGYAGVVLEAQASGLPILATAGTGPSELIEPGRSGCLVPADPDAIAAALTGLARRAAIRDRLSTGGLRAAQLRTWELSLAELAAGWRRALAGEDEVRVAA